MQIAIVIPCYKAKAHILSVIKNLPAQIGRIFVVEDACPDKSGSWVKAEVNDPRVEVIFLPVNLGVGGATIEGLKAAYKCGYDIVIKIDADDQMDSRLIPAFIEPIELGKADYVKGNRFFSPRSLEGMPLVRILGNAGLSFLSKFATGYWNIMDPTNGFFAIHKDILPFLDLDKIEKRYFFESDLLFRLGTIRALVLDVPIWSRYGDEKSNLNTFSALIEFPQKLAIRTMKRFFYRYFLRDVNIGTLFFVMGVLLAGFGITFGAYHWLESYRQGNTTNSGTVMLAALPVLLGIQMLLSALLYDVSSVPTSPIHPTLSKLLGDERRI
jgi:dolichol-phosphate mannosyltransferase